MAERFTAKLAVSALPSRAMAIGNHFDCVAGYDCVRRRRSKSQTDNIDEVISIAWTSNVFSKSTFKYGGTLYSLPQHLEKEQAKLQFS